MCILALSWVGCQSKKKAEVKAQKGTPAAGEIQGLSQKERDFVLLLDKLKQKNPFSKDHAEISKYKFTSGALSLSGIFYDEKRPAAIINDRIVTEGDMVDDKQVIKIMQEEVILKDKEKEYHIKTE